MARAPRSDSALDRLYQLPLGDFIAARNALAKESGDASLKTLAETQRSRLGGQSALLAPSRGLRRARRARADDLRATHMATLQGKRADLRAASRDHEQAVDAALKATLSLLADDGQPATDATKQAIATTLRGLPGDESPGGLTRPIEPRGFDMIAAAAGGGGKVRAAAPEPKARVAVLPARKQESREDGAAEKAAARERAAAAREALAESARARRGLPNRLRGATSSRPPAPRARLTRRTALSHTADAYRCLGESARRSQTSRQSRAAIDRGGEGEREPRQRVTGVRRRDSRSARTRRARRYAEPGKSCALP